MIHEHKLINATIVSCQEMPYCLDPYLPGCGNMLQWNSKGEVPSVVALVDGAFGRVVGVALEDDLLVEDVDLILGLCDFGGDQANEVDLDTGVLDG